MLEYFHMPTINHSNSRPNADEALRKLQDGNIRFTRGESTAPLAQNQILASLARANTLTQRSWAAATHAFLPKSFLMLVSAICLSFALRATYYSPEIAGSLQYAGSHLHTPLFVVLGHSGCGAVQAALETQLFGKQHLSRIQVLIEISCRDYQNPTQNCHDPSSLSAQSKRMCFGQSGNCVRRSRAKCGWLKDK